MNEKAFKFDNMADALSYLRVLTKPVELGEIEAFPVHIPPRPRQRKELIAGGDPVRDPINKQTAMVIAPAAWWAKPLPPPDNSAAETPKEKGTNMAGVTVTGVTQEFRENPNALRVHRINGENMIEMAQVQQMIMQEIARLPKEAGPLVKQAQESREIIDQLLHGIGGEMERFKEECPERIQAIRNTRFAVVSEVTTMLTALKDVRQFFMASDHKDQIERLTAFVELCERLQKLKTSGFLDAVADTMIKLDRPA